MHSRPDSIEVSSATPRTVMTSVILAIGACPVLLAISTWNSVRGTGFQEFLRFTSAPVLLVQLLVVLLALRSGTSPLDLLAGLRRWQQLTLAGFSLIAASTATFVAPDPGLAWFRNAGMVVHLLFGLSVYTLLRSWGPSMSRRLWPAVGAGMLGYLALVILFVAAVLDDPAFDWEVFGLGAINVRQVGRYASIGVAAALGLTLTSRSARATTGWMGAATLLFALGCWTGTRGSLVAFAGSMIAAMLIFPAARSLRMIATFLVTGLGGMIISILVYLPPHPSYGLLRMLSSVERDDLDGFSSGRMEMWQGTLRAIAERPLFGFGDGQFRLTVAESLGSYNHPHNAVLQALLHWGAVGTTCLVALFLPLFLSWWRLASADSRHLPTLLVVVTILAFSTIDGALYYPYSTMIAILCLIWPLALGRSGALRSSMKLVPTASPQCAQT